MKGGVTAHVQVHDGDLERGGARSAVGKAGKPLNQPAALRDLFRYADGVDRLMVLVAFIAAISNGAIVPVFSIIFGGLVNSLGASTEELVDAVNKYVLYLLYLAVAALIGGYLEVAFFSWTGYRQTGTIRKAYLKTILRQDVAWYDTNGGSGKLLQGLNEDSAAFQTAISERLGNFVRNLTTCIGGLIVAFWKGWDMALVIVATMPFLVGVGMAVSAGTGRLKAMVAKANDNTNTIAQEALLNMRTVTSYEMQQSTLAKFEDSLEVPRKAGIRQGFLSGLTVGATSGVFSCSYALAIWYGSLKVADGDYSGGRVINILFAGVMAGFSLGQAVPNIQFIEAGKSACTSLYAVIDRKPDIDVDAPGQEIVEMKGDIELEDVCFSYPTRPDRLVFDGFNLVIPAGSSVALVGESGSGKSSVVQLLQRFYDPSRGKILVDGYDVKTLSLKWWRSQIALVSQEPTLFDESIFNNIAVSKSGSTMEEVVQAATAANAHTFIMRLPEGYNTSVGEQGTQLSGGQKQRIAIARAILRNPRVLLLDEATSALDNQSEKLVQESLDTIMAGRTTVIIAHRLSTVVNADIIAVVRGGKIVDQGSHADLVKRGGFYASMVARQAMHPEQSDTNDDNVPEEGVTSVKKPLKKMRDSVLTRASVRLSIIPQDIAQKLRRKPQDQEKSEGIAFRRLAAMNKPEWRHAIVGIGSSAALGLQMPGFALALAGIIGVFYKPTDEEIKDGGQKWAAIYVGIGFACWIMGMLQGWAFGVMGQNLACRVKMMFLKAVLRQEIGWHDQPDNNTGKLMSRLSSDTMAIRGAVGDQVGVIVQNVATVVAAYCIAFYSSWSLTLVVTSLLPLMCFAQIVQTLMLTGQFTKGGDDAVISNQVALEGVRNIRVISAYGLENHVSLKYAQASARSADARILQLAGLAYGFSQFILYCVICLAFWYGARGMKKGNLEVEDLMRAFCALFFATFSLAQANVQFPDMGKAQKAAERVFSVIDRTPDIDHENQGGAKLPLVDGDVELEDVTFAYPSRPGRLIFKHFSLKIPAGSSCALVGESGHGKSTIIGLLERFYDATDGKVMLDGVDIRSLNLQWVRSKLGLVGQEPVMFKATIMENIKYGNPNATMTQIVDAARAANALEFLNKLPEQLDTMIGEGGIQLSGGQKQRIAIARAILRDPKILLLDEATSALDADSEAVVQQALDSFMVGRTTIIVAHRLTTVRNATKIAAVYRGRVLEQGTHDELMQVDRYYAYLVRASQC